MRNLVIILFAILICSVGFSCRKDSSKFLGSNTGNTENPDDTIPTKPTSEYYFKGKFDNVSALWEANGENNWGLGTSSSTSLDGQAGTIKGRIGPSIYQPDPNNGSFGKGISIEFGVFFTDAEFKKDVLKSLLKTGFWDFETPSTDLPDFKNVAISYRTIDGSIYGVSNGDQTGSKFEVLSIVFVPASGFTPEYYDIKFKFNCKLYPLNPTSTTKIITLTDAEGNLSIDNSL